MSSSVLTKHLGMGRKTLLRLRNEGVLRAGDHYLPGHHLKWDLNAVEGALRDHAREQQKQTARAEVQLPETYTDMGVGF